MTAGARLLWAVCTLGLTLGLTLACSPTLNWREVQLGDLKAMLPCKPDHAERQLPLGSQNVTMAMAGCEASGALYAISHVRLANPALADAAQADWRAAMLAHFLSPAIDKQAYQLARPTVAARLAAAGPSRAVLTSGLEILQVQGKDSDGAALQARMLWIAQGADVYHVAIYAPKLTPDQFDMLFSELALQ